MVKQGKNETVGIVRDVVDHWLADCKPSDCKMFRRYPNIVREMWACARMIFPARESLDWSENFGEDVRKEDYAMLEGMLQANWRTFRDWE